jgi:hypothetical protein
MLPRHYLIMLPESLCYDATLYATRDTTFLWYHSHSAIMLHASPWYNDAKVTLLLCYHRCYLIMIPESLWTYATKTNLIMLPESLCYYATLYATRDTTLLWYQSNSAILLTESLHYYDTKVTLLLCYHCQSAIMLPDVIGSNCPCNG